MKKTILFLAMLMLVMASCKPSANQETESTKADVEQSLKELSERVQDIYASVYEVYILEDSLRNLDKLEGSPAWENRNRFNNDYCTKGLNDLFRQVNEIDSIYHNGELGFFEADYWLMAQDWGSDLKVSDVKVLSMTDHEALVEILIHNLGNNNPVQLKMLKEDGLWKIDSFIDADNNIDLKKEMEQYVSDEIKKNKK